MRKFRDELIEDDSDEDIDNSELYNSILLRNQNKIKAGLISDESSIEVFVKNSKEYSLENWILEGFPKTKSQALALSKNQIVPDKIFVMKYSDEVSINHVLEGLKQKHGEDY